MTPTALEQSCRHDSSKFALKGQENKPIVATISVWTKTYLNTIPAHATLSNESTDSELRSRKGRSKFLA